MPSTEKLVDPNILRETKKDESKRRAEEIVSVIHFNSCKVKKSNAVPKCEQL